MVIHELRNIINVQTPLGSGKAIAWIDYGSEVNTIWKVILTGGIVRNFYDNDILVMPNKMDGSKLDIDYFNNKTIKDHDNK